MAGDEPVSDYPREPGCGTLVFRAVVVADVLTLALGFIITQQPSPYGMDIGPGPGFFGVLLFVPAALLGVVLAIVWLTVGHASAEGVRILLGLGLTLFVIAVLANSGVWPPRTYYPPDAQGTIVEIHKQWDVSYLLTLASGEQADVSHGGWVQGGPTPGAGAFVPIDGMPDLRIGDLLIAGKRPTPWYLIAQADPGPPSPNGCYLLIVEAAEEETISSCLLACGSTRRLATTVESMHSRT